MASMTMHPLSPADLLDVWDDAVRERSIDRRAVALLSAACGQSPEAVAGLSIGSRDRMLLTLREWIFGTRLSFVSNCPSCGEAVEGKVSTTDLATSSQSSHERDLTFQAGDVEVAFRLPTTEDLRAIEGARNVPEARDHLLQRCVPNYCELPAQLLESLISHMGEIDSQADIQLSLHCPVCFHDWTAPFDIAHFLWTEVQAWGQRLLREIHTLASRYGWSERDIVMLSPARRQSYLDLVAGE
jgi:hypothetical protein